MKNSELTNLKSFLSGYFHEDWPLESDGPDDAIRRFLASGPGVVLRERIVAEIDEYLATKEAADIEKGLLMDLGCYSLPSADGMRASARSTGRHKVPAGHELIRMVCCPGWFASCAMTAWPTGVAPCSAAERSARAGCEAGGQARGGVPDCVWMRATGTSPVIKGTSR